MDDTHARHQDDLTRYVLGEMSLDEQLAFDVRMTEDKQLARTVAAAMAIDDLLFRAAGPQGGDPSLGLD
jgi:anti-sigma factor RsiW